MSIVYYFFSIWSRWKQSRKWRAQGTYFKRSLKKTIQTKPPSCFRNFFRWHTTRHVSIQSPTDFLGWSSNYFWYLLLSVFQINSVALSESLSVYQLLSPLGSESLHQSVISSVILSVNGTATINQSLTRALGPIRNRKTVEKNHPQPKKNQIKTGHSMQNCLNRYIFTSRLSEPWSIRHSGDKWSIQSKLH